MKEEQKDKKDKKKGGKDEEGLSTIMPLRAKPAKEQKIGVGQACGCGGRGSEGRNFCPPAHRAEGAAGVGAFPPLRVSGMPKQKNFLFLN